MDPDDNQTYSWEEMRRDGMGHGMGGVAWEVGVDDESMFRGSLKH